GQASTWAEVYRLLGVQGVHFMGKPGAAEGPSAFYLSGAVARRVEDSVRSVDETAESRASGRRPTSSSCHKARSTFQNTGLPAMMSASALALGMSVGVRTTIFSPL